MSIPLTVDGVQYTYPESGDTGLGAQASAWAEAVTDAIATIQDKPYVEYTTSAGQSIPDTTTTIVNFGTLVHDASSLVTTGASWHFTAPTAGDYMLAVNVEFPSSGTTASSQFYLGVYVNGAEAAELSNHVLTPVANNVYSMSGSTLLHLAATDTVDVRVKQVTSASKSLSTTAVKNRITIKALE